ncbi:FTR1-domain-containing protein [Nadsonia fulvescens var. elongata DSM 6958]|uniref:FTR1-domain-containing protein n=1 Tax=Nadsonia fulvescens var. elongata DSM 6958 TaxID=857566 RepID=A0A1E3PJD0_9ASCO|nr:FTR1-domain-containing protein [Nadsonia fulvescens var. elongata DSM 6958]
MFFEDYFSIQVFFLIFRETIETAIIVSVLLAFIKQGLGENSTDSKVYKQLVTQIWVGAILGLLICMCIGASFVFIFYKFGTNLWNQTEKIWEATFCILAAVVITVMGMAMLRINKMKEKWRVKIARSIIETHEGRGSWGLRYLSRKYALAILPFITTLREGLEAVVFLGGLGMSQNYTAFPLAVVTAISLGSVIGCGMYKYGNSVSINYFLIGSTCFLYMVAAGLFSRGVWFLELQQFINHVGSDVSESGSGHGSYDVTKSIWHVNCCNGQTDGIWMILNALIGWQNSPTYGTIVAYNIYWIAVITSVFCMLFKEKHGYNPILPKFLQKKKKDYELINEEEADNLMLRASALYQNINVSNPVDNTAEAVISKPDSAGDDFQADIQKPVTFAYGTTLGSSRSPRIKGVPRNSLDSLSSNTPLVA